MRLLESIHNFDLLTFDWCHRRKNHEILVEVSRWVSKTADGPLYVVCGIVLALNNYYAVIPAFLAAFVLERTLYTLIKKFFKRNRPPEAIPNYQSAIIPSDQFSFPSGHTSAAFMMTIILSGLFPQLFWALLPWAASVGASRVMLGVHFPTDTLAGATLGLSCGLFTLNYLL
ncbi:phosphatase PAP2 family protein [Halioxenophilus sp. WMMB6]|uniref:phosphatase PAP2 family protein n=1 Tax=Halioxenophilus sp. WMMB6 TaxID=3073815 RepID=UPI00295F068B|nr:phosphatase PAP2 family protein [Halioxenophilus sp. WMMB6]